MNDVEGILELWSKLTGFDPSARSFTYSDLDVRAMSEAVRRAQELDPSDALAMLLLDAFLRTFLQGRKFSAAEMLADLDTHFAFLRDARALRALLDGSGMPEARQALSDWTRRALAHYGAAEREDVAKVLTDPDKLAFLRRDALESTVKGLEAHQFMQGEPDGGQPRYVDHVLQVHSVSGLLQAMVGMPSGILLALVREPAATNSFFVVGIRNGGTLTLLTDRTKWANSFQKDQQRRPERHLDSRMQQAHFPYQLLGIEVDGESGDIWVEREEGILPAGFVARKAKAIRDLPAEQAIWLAMLFDALSDRFFRRDHRVAELSYLGAQVRGASPMEIEAQARNLPVTGYAPLVAPPIRSVELDAARMVAEGDTREPSRAHPNAWLEARYAGMVDDASIDLLAGPGERPALIGRRDGLGQAIAPLVPAEKLAALSTEEFGTARELLADRIVFARHNQALAINALAKAEFVAREAEIRAWWLKAMRRRKEALLALVAEGTMPSVGSFQGRHGPVSAPWMDCDILHIRNNDDLGGSERGYNHFNGVILADEKAARSEWWGKTGRHKPLPSGKCTLRGYASTWRCRFSPYVADDLAAMAGVPVGKLPDVLRNWTRDHRYDGNRHLDRIDPLEWMGVDPWRALDFKVEIGLSDSGFAQLCNAHGKPGPDRFRYYPNGKRIVPY